MFYEEVLRALQNHGVRYLIIGGAAVNLHGVPRMTGDLDLAIDRSSENVEAIVAATKEAGLEPSLPVDPSGLSDPVQRKLWHQEKHLKALTFQSIGGKKPYREVDIILEPSIVFEKMYEERTQLQVDDITVDLVSLQHLMEIKRGLGREQDLADVEALEKINGEGGE